MKSGCKLLQPFHSIASPVWGSSGRGSHALVSVWLLLSRTLSLLKPVESSPLKKKMRGNSLYAMADLVSVAQQVSAEYSNPTHDPPIVCKIVPNTLHEYARARDAGEEIASA